MSAKDEIEIKKRFIEAGLEGVERPLRDAVEEVISHLSTHQAELEQVKEELRMREHELELFNARYNRLLNSTPVGIISSDGEGVITEVNNTACAMLSEERQVIVGSKLIDWIAADFQNQIHT